MADIDLEFYRGDTYERGLVFKTSSGAAVVITDCTIWFTIKENKADLDSAALLQKKITSHTNPTGGISLLELSTTDTDIEPGTYYYDFQFKSAAGKVFTTGEGRVTVKQDITITTT